jgi:NADH pyrophosphatase NudC (nudix superfamily)
MAGLLGPGEPGGIKIDHSSELPSARYVSILEYLKDLEEWGKLRALQSAQELSRVLRVLNTRAIGLRRGSYHVNMCASVSKRRRE